MSKFKITGPGEYRTRGGEKAIVDVYEEAREWPWRGIIVGNSGIHECWDDFGSWSRDEDSAFDIVGPWDETAKDPGEEQIQMPYQMTETLRDKYATAVIIGLLSGRQIAFDDNYTDQFVAQVSFITDKLMEERRKGGAA